MLADVSFQLWIECQPRPDSVFGLSLLDADPFVHDLMQLAEMVHCISVFAELPRFGTEFCGGA